MSEEDLLQKARELFGLSSFRGLQFPAIRSFLEGKDALVIFPTGFGKSLVYQFPSQLIEGLTLVVSPLISLMQDQTESLKRRGIKDVAFLSSSQSLEEQSEILSSLEKLSLLYISPERLRNRNFREKISKRVSRLVVDEAHCVSTWGMNFRPAYRELSGLSRWFPKVPIFALTATATPAIKKDIIRVLKLRRAEIFELASVRENLAIRLEIGDDVRIQLQDLLKDSLPTVIYMRSRYRCDQLSYELSKSGFSVLPYHAGMSAEEREKTQNKFLKNEVQILVATSAFGMGVDKPDIRRVIHLEIPNEPEEYVQEIGRAGRDGKSAEALMFVSFKALDDWVKRHRRSYPKWRDLKEAFLNRESPFSDAKERLADLFGVREWRDFRRFYFVYRRLRKNQETKMQAMADFMGNRFCRSVFLSRYFGFKTEACGICDFCRKKPLSLSKEAIKMLRFIRAVGKTNFSEVRDALQGRDISFLLYPNYAFFRGFSSLEIEKIFFELLKKGEIGPIYRCEKLFFG